MKNSIFSLIICLGTTFAMNAQTNMNNILTLENQATAFVNTQTNEEPTKNLKADVMNRDAQFPGGMKALRKFLNYNMKYSEVAQENYIEGVVMVKFAVNPDGTLSDVQVVKSDDTILNEQAMNIVKAMPNWKPAVKAGYYTTKKVIIPIQFSLR